MPTQASRKRMSRVLPVIPFLYHAGSFDPTNHHQDDGRWAMYAALLQCYDHEKRRIGTSGHCSRASFKTPRPHGCLPLARFDHVRKLHKPRHISALRARQLAVTFSHHYSTYLQRTVNNGAKPRFDSLSMRIDTKTFLSNCCNLLPPSSCT